MKTRTQIVSEDIANSLRARTPVMIVVTREEARAEINIAKAAGVAGYTARTWDVAQGILQLDGKPVSNDDTRDPGEALNWIRGRSQNTNSMERAVYIMRDLLPWTSGPGGAPVQRLLRNLARSLPGVPRDNAHAIVILSAGGDVPAELAAHAVVVDFPLPDRAEIEDTLDATIRTLPEKYRGNACTNGSREAAIDAALGLSGEEAQACYAKSLVATQTIDPAIVSKEKKNVISRERVLEWYDPIPGGLDWVGGMEMLKSWLKSRASAYTIKAREYGLPSPKGIMLVGIPGCGKSLFAKAVAAALSVPLIRLDMGALKSKFVGESEGNLRKALKVIEALGRCVVWLDEIEKALQGATSGSADGGVSADALGTFLSWMQERQGDAFVIATANDISALPPELLRKGRFDELFFVDLPTATEREAVIQAAIKQYRAPCNGIDAAAIARVTEDFTGSEIAQLVPDAMFVGFNDGARPITTADLVKAADAAKKSILAKTAAEKITNLRRLAQGRFRPASAAEEVGPTSTGTVLDI